VYHDEVLDVQVTQTQDLGTPLINVALVTDKVMSIEKKERRHGNSGEHGWQFDLGNYRQRGAEYQESRLNRVQVYTDMGLSKSEEFEQESAEGDLYNKGSFDGRSSAKARRGGFDEDPSDYTRRRIPHGPISHKARRESSDGRSSTKANIGTFDDSEQEADEEYFTKESEQGSQEGYTSDDEYEQGKSAGRVKRWKYTLPQFSTSTCKR
jgi:hypothetical protein